MSEKNASVESIQPTMITAKCIVTNAHLTREISENGISVARRIVITTEAPKSGNMTKKWEYDEEWLRGDDE